MYFDDGKYLGYLNLATDTAEMQNTKNELFLTFGFGTLLAMILLSINIISLFNLFITRPIKTILFGINEVKEGNLGSSIDMNSVDKLGLISASINASNHQIREVVSKVIVETNNLQKASGELKQNSIELSGDANQLASVTEEVASSMEEMVSNIQLNSGNAESTKKIFRLAADEIQR